MRITFITASAVSLLKYLVLYSPFLWWCEMIKKHEMKLDEWRRYCDLALGYFWPSDNASEGGLSVTSDPGSWSQKTVDGGVAEADGGCWWLGTCVHHTTKQPNLKHVDCLLLEYSFLKFLDCSWLQVIETMESEITR